MALTHDELEKLRLTHDEIGQLGLTHDDLSNMSYVQLSELVSVRLNRKIPSDPDALMEYMRSVKSSVEVMQSSFEEECNKIAKDRARQSDQELAQMKGKRVDRFLDFVYFVFGLLFGYILGWVHPLANISPGEIWITVVDFFRGLFH
ncbi:hypothetical protein LJC74_05645 [Eubacteriales bacterium OttesenSCG-928-A19]|nr:hypothetical protein [Eubacteriales bacterium OttesenSCG-928-A19]